MVIEELKQLYIENTLVLGSVKRMSVPDILANITREQVIKMFSNNLDVKYILLDYGKEGS